jgi:hypothetical protein
VSQTKVRPQAPAVTDNGAQIQAQAKAAEARASAAEQELAALKAQMATAKAPKAKAEKEPAVPVFAAPAMPALEGAVS